MTCDGDCESAFGLVLSANIVQYELMIICFSIFYSDFWIRDGLLLFEMQKELFQIGDADEFNVGDEGGLGEIFYGQINFFNIFFLCNFYDIDDAANWPKFAC